MNDINEMLEKSKERDRLLRNRLGEQSIGGDETLYYEARGSETSTARSASTNVSSSTTTLATDSQSNLETQIEKLAQKSSSVTKIESEMQGTDETPTRYLNINKDNLQMEIKLTSMDNCKVQVEIHDTMPRDQTSHSSPNRMGMSTPIKKDRGANDDDNDDNNDGDGEHGDDITDNGNTDNSPDSTCSIRSEMKSKLNRLGKMYSDSEAYSPIHKTNDRLPMAKKSSTSTASICSNSSLNSEKLIEKAVSGIRLGKLAALAQNINDWEDDLKHTSHSSNSRFNSLNVSQSNKKSKMSTGTTATHKPVASPRTQLRTSDSSIHLNDSIVGNLEAQGYKRVQSGEGSSLIYEYGQSPSLVPSTIASPSPSPSPSPSRIPVRITEKENKTGTSASNVQKPLPKSSTTTTDPSLLSVSERKALFERNRGGSVIVPKTTASASNNTFVKPANPTKVAPKQTGTKPTITSSRASNNEIIKKKLPAIKSILDEECDRDDVNKPCSRNSLVALKSSKIASKVSEMFESKCKAASNTSCTNVEPVAVREKVSKSVKIVDAKMKSPFKSLISDECSDEEVLKKTGPKDSVIVKSVLDDVKKIRVSPARDGHLYPNVSDIETATETEAATETETNTTNENSENSSNNVVENINFDAEDTLINDALNYDSDENMGNDNSGGGGGDGDNDDDDDDDVNNSNPINQTFTKKRSNDTLSLNSSDLSNMLNQDIDEYLANESFSFEGPTPPKVYKKKKFETPTSPQQQNSNSFRNCQIDPNRGQQLTETEMEISTPATLTHSVSVYRLQQNQSRSTNSPIQVVMNSTYTIETNDTDEENRNDNGDIEMDFDFDDDDGDDDDSSRNENVKNGDHRQRERERERERERRHITNLDCDNRQLIQEKISELKEQIQKQQTIISQASQALNFCCSTVEFFGSSEYVEAQKLLLIATSRRHALVNEIQRLNVEETLRQKNKHGEYETDYGSLTVSNIRIPLKNTYSKALKSVGGKGHHVICLLKCNENVAASQLASTVASDDYPTYVEIPGSIVLNPVFADFTAELEIYCLEAQDENLSHEAKYHINKKSSGNKLTPSFLKNDQKLTKVNIQSPAGPNSVRTSDFALMGYVMFSLQTSKKSTWTLNNVAQMNPLDVAVQMKIACKLLTFVSHKGFLTIFDDSTGMGAWHRRWCILKEHKLRCWMYPNDEKTKEPLDTIDLKTAISEEVKPANRELCARQNTLLIECRREKLPTDRESLTTVCCETKTIIRYLLSADTKDERNEWCKYFTKTLKSMRDWGVSML